MGRINIEIKAVYFECKDNGGLEFSSSFSRIDNFVKAWLVSSKLGVINYFTCFEVIGGAQIINGKSWTSNLRLFSSRLFSS